VQPAFRTYRDYYTRQLYLRLLTHRARDGATYLNLLQFEDGIQNPLPALPEGKEFGEKLKSWLVSR
jgi:hypothetical protein